MKKDVCTFRVPFTVLEFPCPLYILSNLSMNILKGGRFGISRPWYHYNKCNFEYEDFMYRSHSEKKAVCVQIIYKCTSHSF